MITHEECENLKAFVDSGEVTRNIKKRRSQAFGKLIDVDFVTNFIGENISSISMWNIVNQ